MIKLTFCLRRRPDLTWEEFSRYWRDIHAPLVAERAEVLGILRYVQVRTADLPRLHDAYRARNRSPEPYDGVAELWFADLDPGSKPTDAQRRANAELLADERNFIDLAGSPMWMGEEWEVVPRRAGHIGTAP